VVKYSKNTKKRVRILPLALLFFALIIALLLIDSNFRIVTTEYEIYFSNLPEPFDGFRIVLLADIHDTQFGKDNDRLISRVNDASPDIIVIAGDLINAYFNHRPIEKQLERAVALVVKLNMIAPVYFVTGNHEISDVFGGSEALESVLEEQGVRVLKSDYETIGSDSSNIILAGIDANKGNLTKKTEFITKLSRDEKGSFILLIEHRNDSLQLCSENGIDLILSGHAHGGVIRLPFIGGVIGPDRDLFPEYSDGVYTLGDTTMLVSRGLGRTAIWPRFLNNPQIAVAVLRSEKNTE